MLLILTQNQQTIIHVQEVSVSGKKIEGMILGSTAWAKLLGKYESNERAAEILQDMMKTIEEHPNATMTYRMPPQ